jgi:hypothetical protein
MMVFLCRNMQLFLNEKRGSVWRNDLFLVLKHSAMLFVKLALTRAKVASATFHVPCNTSHLFKEIPF